ncbi:MAG: FAD-binding oxidoreductase [Acidobacterium ailaaui]|nr:FAD-binding oxidoreductase [Pseudacidobacterium ailaaui]
MKRKITNWGNYPAVESELYHFRTEEELKKLISLPSVIARGNGRCYGDSSLAPFILSTLHFNKALSFDMENGIFECEAGMLLDDILQIIVPRGWFLPVSPGTKYITVGGAIASNIHGKNHHIDGTFCRHLIEMDVLTADGKIYTCSPYQQSDLFHATCGGMGLTGIILRAKFYLKKIETSYIKQTQIKARDLFEILDLFETYRSQPYTMAWIDCLKQGKHVGRSIMMMGETATREHLKQSHIATALDVHPQKHISFPVNMPSFVLNPFSVRAFNQVFYMKNWKKEIHNIVHYDPFFYPLDKILHWNRGYGKNGFIQYQFVLPIENSKKGLIDILKRINRYGIGSFLAVLKLFGKDESFFSFPMEGYTLALDFPMKQGLLPFLDELDRVVLDYGGRLYLTKDARMKPEIFWKGYPNAESWHEIMMKYNKGYKFRSSQSDRLEITAPANKKNYANSTHIRSHF